MTEPAERTRIYVVDDDVSVRASLSAFLSAHGFEPAAYADGEDFLSHFEPEVGLCAFLDLRMPGLSGMELQEVLTRRGIALPLIILTAHGDVPMAVAAMKRGAVDFIEKPASEAQLLHAIDTAASLQSNRMQTGLQQGVVAQRVARLTQREKHVLDHLILGKTSKHIADELGISQRTVEIHRSRIREKMEARGLSDLIRMMR